VTLACPVANRHAARLQANMCALKTTSRSEAVGDRLGYAPISQREISEMLPRPMTWRPPALAILLGNLRGADACGIGGVYSLVLGNRRRPDSENGI